MRISEVRAHARALVVATGTLLAAACAERAVGFELGGFRYDPEQFVQWKLPKKLREISGLALDS